MGVGRVIPKDVEHPCACLLGGIGLSRMHNDKQASNYNLLSRSSGDHSHHLLSWSLSSNTPRKLPGVFRVAPLGSQKFQALGISWDLWDPLQHPASTRQACASPAEGAIEMGKRRQATDSLEYYHEFLVPTHLLILLPTHLRSSEHQNHIRTRPQQDVQGDSLGYCCP